VVVRLIATAGALAAALILALGAGPAAAQAKPKPAPTALQIAGKGLPGNKVVIQQKTQLELFRLMLSEVSWLANATPQANAPRSRSLGPKYTVTVLVKNTPQQVYDLYPAAKGGPRAHRPAKQPTGRRARTTDAQTPTTDRGKKHRTMSAGLHPVIMHDLATSQVAEERRRAERSRRRPAAKRATRSRRGR